MAPRLKKFEPMLAEKLVDAPFSSLRYPVFGTPKLDGIRCAVLSNGQAVTRSLRRWPNLHVRRTIEGLEQPFLDGEVLVPKTTHHGATSSALMKCSGEPAYEFHIFDYFQEPELPYVERVGRLRALGKRWPEWIKILEPHVLHNVVDLVRYEKWCLDEGYEGCVVRTGDSPYKYGRSTMREQYMIAIKRFLDSEARIVGGFALRKNQNPLKTDARGYAKRSKAKAGLVPRDDLLGGFICERDGVSFEIGSGFTLDQRAEYMDRLQGLIDGRWYAKYKHQPHGAKEKPRAPIFLDLRHPDDLD